MKALCLIISLCLSLFSNAESDTTILRIEKIKDLKERAKQYNSSSQTAWEIGEYNKALEYTSLGIKICEENDFLREKSLLLNNRGIAFDYLGDYPSALTNLFKALRIQEKMNFPDQKAYVLSNIGLIYSYQEKVKLSLEYHQKSLNIRRELNDLSAISSSLNNIAIVYVIQKDYPEALKNYLECIKIDKELNDQRGLGDDYNNIGLCYLDMKMYDKSMEYFSESLKIREANNNRLGVCEIYTNIGSLYYTTKRYIEARDYFLVSIPIANELGSKISLRFTYENLTKIEEKLGDYEKSLEYYKLFIAYRDSIDNSENTRVQTELEMHYKFDKEKEASRLIQERKEAQVRTVLYTISIGLLLIIIFSILLFKRWKYAQSQQKIIEEKNHLVEQKNEEIMDSITYAKRIQTAILPSAQLLNELIPNQFVLYLPKDIVAGDFYWLENLKDKIFFAVADCTGHGVPGAMMSVVCHNALNRSVREFGLTEPGLILDKTRDIIVSELSKNDHAVSDGMDISLCVLDQKENTISWAGANNPLWIYRSTTQQMEEWKANKQPIGVYGNYIPFTTQVIEVYKNDRIYLFTDGFADQFGGDKGKKLMKKAFQNLLLKTSTLSTEKQKIELEQFYWSWKGGLDQVDDVCVSCVVI